MLKRETVPLLLKEILLKNKLLLLLLFSAFTFAGTYQTPNSFHLDHRSGMVKLAFIPSVNEKVKREPQAVANAFLAQFIHANPSLEPVQLRLALVKESLLGRHYHYQQLLNGLKVAHGELVLSVSKQSGQVYQLYNNLYPVDGSQKMGPKKAAFSEAEAYQIAWQQMRVHGGLIAEPKAELVYLPVADDFRLVYWTNLSVSAPFGYWRHVIDAESGEILEVSDRALSRNPKAEVDFEAYNGTVTDRQAAFLRFEEKATHEAAESASTLKNAQKATGTGKVFDPDPVTTLQMPLSDLALGSAFTAAYFIKPLRDISLSGGRYLLDGPWVQIKDFEAPNTAPSTSSSGNWDAVRGNNAFNDAMTYFHIDQTQRYMQTLGFSGSTGIQYHSIEVDTDGVEGDDNSHYVPDSDVLAFGHGCVDDNEDAFVILHEYGHAITFDINPNFEGGDSGAIGEGFGDYWAGSYKYGTANGASYHPEWAFPFDGHNNCWEGRRMDNTAAQYVHSTRYSAHQFVNGFTSDELWSTPLFQALTTLVEQGVSHAQVDKIILQAQFGLGFGLKMRDMANAIVHTAQQLYPSGPQAYVFTLKFQAQGILQGEPPPPPAVAVELSNGQSLGELSGLVSLEAQYFIQVPANASNLKISISGGSGDCDLYVKYGEEPSLSRYDFRPYLIGNNETVTLKSPQEGSYGIMLRGYQAYSGVSLTVSFTANGSVENGDWNSAVFTAETPHNYANHEVYEVTFSQAGALKVAIHFDQLITESGYDHIDIYDDANHRLFHLSGKLIAAGGLGKPFTAAEEEGWLTVTGSSVRVVLTTDNSVTKYGFKIDAAKYFQ